MRAQSCGRHIVGHLQHRLGSIERKLEPGTVITGKQAAEISNRVKAIVESLSQRDTSKNHYQAIFGELCRRFNVSSYKNIRKDQYQDVFKFLDEWLNATSGS